MAKLSREELIAIVRKIQTAAGTEEQIHAWLTEFLTNITHPAGSDLIYYPAHGEPTAEQVVDEALAWKSG